MVMPTDLSPVPDMIQSGLSETTVLGGYEGLVGAAAVAGVVLLVNWLHLRHQKKISSINVSLKMLEYWEKEKHKDFSAMVELVYKHKVKGYLCQFVTY